ncbi:MAG: hypothetical protein AAF721_04825 [Myxococcota bacterium]
MLRRGWGSCLALALLATAACDGAKKEASKDAASASKAAPPKAVPNKPLHNPHETPEAMKAQKRVLRSQEGTFDLTVGDKTTHFPQLPIGQNAAVHFEGKKGRISVSGTAEDGYPSFRAEMIGWRLDQLELPITLSGDDKQIVRFRYRVGERGEYNSDDEATKRGENKVTLESYEGNVVSGTFEGTVAPKSETVGPPLKVSGKFKTTLRLQGVKRAPAKADAGADAKADAKAPAGAPH